MNAMYVPTGKLKTFFSGRSSTAKLCIEEQQQRTSNLRERLMKTETSGQLLQAKRHCQCGENGYRNFDPHFASVIQLSNMPCIKIKHPSAND